MITRRAFCGAAASAVVAGRSLTTLAADHKRPRQPDPTKVPEKFSVRMETSIGNIVIDVTRDWSPNGAARFYDAVQAGFYDECRFFRVIPGFVVQWGINGDPQVQKIWRDAEFADDNVPASKRASNTRGFVTFAKSSRPNSRTTQLFINFGDNARLDELGFTPFGKVVEGMNVVDRINSKYRERPDQGSIQERGNAYLNAEFPDLDFIKRATIVKPQT
jgi:peptidyl-prolyl cis-trans isomerase A (cyclophilin A)